MKKISILIVFIFSAFVFVSCEDNKNVQLDTVNGQALVAFDGSTFDLPVNIDTGVGTVDVPINITTSSNSDRTVSVSVIASDSDAPATSYSVSGTATIPAGAYNGVLTVNGASAGLTPGVNTKLVLQISSADADIINEAKVTVNVFLVCPIPDGAFTGRYLIEQTSPFVDGPTLSDGTIVEVTASDNDSRQFQTQNYPDYCSSFMTFTFDLVCGQIIVPNTDTVCRCSSVTDWFTVAANPEMYDINDDSTFLLTFTDDTQNDCGAPAQTTYRFTKQP